MGGPSRADEEPVLDLVEALPVVVASQRLMRTVEPLPHSFVSDFTACALKATRVQLRGDFLGGVALNV